MTCTMSELDELIEKLEKEAEYIEKDFKMYIVVDPLIHKALATILKTLKKLAGEKQ